MKKFVSISAALALCAISAAAQGTVPSGTAVQITLNQTVSSKDAQVNQPVDGVVAEDVVVNGKTVVPRGAKANLIVATAEASGRLSGQAKLWLKLESLEVNGRTYSVDSALAGGDGASHTKRNTVAIGGGAAAGAVVGALAGGGKGAAIGTAIGAGAGTGAAAATGKKDIEFPAESQLTFKLNAPVTVQAASRGAGKGLKKGHRSS